MNISDTLFEAADEIRSSLNHPITGRAYTGETRKRIEKLLNEMDAVRALPGLDTPPTPEQQADIINDDRHTGLTPSSTVSAADRAAGLVNSVPKQKQKKG